MKAAGLLRTLALEPVGTGSLSSRALLVKPSWPTKFASVATFMRAVRALKCRFDVPFGLEGTLRPAEPDFAPDGLALGVGVCIRVGLGWYLTRNLCCSRR